LGIILGEVILSPTLTWPFPKLPEVRKCIHFGIHSSSQGTNLRSTQAKLNTLE
jgi:hypothetical protein